MFLVDDIELSLGQLNGDYIEAQAFAFLAARSFYRMSLSTAMTTGVTNTVSGGALYLKIIYLN